MRFFKKKFVFCLFLIFSLFVLFDVALAVTEKECNEKTDVQDRITCLESLLESTATKRVTLSSEIGRLNTSIVLTATKMAKTIGEIKVIEKEIEGLTGKIERLNSSLDEISNLLVKRISATYRKGKPDIFELFFSTKRFSDFVVRYKYLKVTQIHDRKLLLQMETARSNYDTQKTLKEQKQDELEAAKKVLEGQRNLLASQKQAKDNLLAVTKNDEKRYQQLLAQAIAQQEALSRFVSGQGGATILENQTKCDSWGCYYSQRDSEWGRNSLGISGLSVAEYGCLVSSVAMIASHHGINIKPLDIASNPSAFFSDTALLLNSFSVNGISVEKRHVSKSLLDSELGAGRPVIAGLYSGPDHFIVIKEKSGDNYIMHDPFLENGANRPLSDKYSVSDIKTLRLISFH